MRSKVFSVHHSMTLKEKHTDLMFTVWVFVQGGGAVWWPIVVDGSKKRQCCLLFPLHLEEVYIYIYKAIQGKN